MENQFLKSAFKWNKRKLSRKELNALHCSPGFARRLLQEGSNAISLPLEEAIPLDNKFWENLTQDEIDRYIREGKKVYKKMRRKRLLKKIIRALKFERIT